MIKREKNKKHDCPTKAKKHRADRALSKFSAFNKLTARLKVLYYQSPTFFSQTVIPHKKVKNNNHGFTR